MTKKIIVANWKMNPQNLEEAERLLDAVIHNIKGIDLKNLELIFVPPFTYLIDLKKRLPKGVHLGAQNLAFAEKGPYTGEISALMLKNIGCSHVIIGHSERRWKLGETGEMINLKVKLAKATGLKPLLAVGEKEETDDLAEILNSQLKEALTGLDETILDDLIIAYEPVWAIGTGKPDTPDGALTAAILIRKIIGNIYKNYDAVKLPVLYGGSVTVDNIKSFVLQNGIDGALVGGASLDALGFTKMLKLINI